VRHYSASNPRIRGWAASAVGENPRPPEHPTDGHNVAYNPFFCIVPNYFRFSNLMGLGGEKMQILRFVFNKIMGLGKFAIVDTKSS
jgi:hypothetical protein